VYKRQRPQLRGRTGGLLGRSPTSQAEAEEVPAEHAAPFCGRAVIPLADIAERCVLRGGPVCDTLTLCDTPGGALVLTLEWRVFHALPCGDDAPMAAVPDADIAPEEVLPTDSPLRLPNTSPPTEENSAAVAAMAAAAGARVAARRMPTRLRMFSKPRVVVPAGSGSFAEAEEDGGCTTCQVQCSCSVQ
jgi:hypothetical protein